MRGTVTVITAEGLISTHALDKTPTLEQFKEWLDGGFLELVPFWNNFNNMRCAVFCDEEGKLKNLPFNRLATHLWRIIAERPLDDVLVGPIVIVTGDRELMDDL